MSWNLEISLSLVEISLSLAEILLSLVAHLLVTNLSNGFITIENCGYVMQIVEQVQGK
jgi:hypothetical protein